MFALISMTALVMGALVRREHLLRIDSDANEICHSGLIGYLKRLFVSGSQLKEWACGSVLVKCRFCVLVAYRLSGFSLYRGLPGASLPSAICTRRIVHQISE